MSFSPSVDSSQKNSKGFPPFLSLITLRVVSLINNWSVHILVELKQYLLNTWEVVQSDFSCPELIWTMKFRIWVLIATYHFGYGTMELAIYISMILQAMTDTFWIVKQESR